MHEQNTRGQKLHVAADDAFQDRGFVKNYKQNFKNQPSTCGHQIFNDENKKEKNNLLTSLQGWKGSGLR